MLRMKCKPIIAFMIIFLMFCFKDVTYADYANGMGDVIITGGQRDFQWPVPTSVSISSCFLDQMGHNGNKHNAIDISADQYSAVVASYSGIVAAVNNTCKDDCPIGNGKTSGSGYGNYVVLKHDNYRLSTGRTITLYTRYNHLSNAMVSVGQSVSKGQQIGRVGSTGSSYGYHLDFQICYGGYSASNSLDPYVNYLLELPNGLNANRASSWCTCCYKYVEEVKKLYSEIPGPISIHNPIGSLDTVEGLDGKLHIRGWALDYDSLDTALQIHVYVGGPSGSSNIVYSTGNVVANTLRADVPINMGNSALGNYHGFDVTLDVGYTGTYPVYVYAINVGARDNNNCNTLLLGAPKIATVNSAVQTCSTPNISFTDVAGGKQLTITADDDDTIDYVIKRNGIATANGTSQGTYTATLSNVGNYEVSSYAKKDGKYKSGTTTRSTAITQVELPVLTQSIAGNGVMVNIESSTPGTTIYYTTSGNTPTTSSNKYTGALVLDTKKTVKAFAVKDGYVNSTVGELKIKLTVPDAPTGFMLSGAEKIAVGENVEVKWESVSAAASYTVDLYKENKRISSVTTSNTNAALNLIETGKYQIKIYSTNFVGNSVVSETVLNVEAMDPLKVQFVDWDGSVIKSQTVPYGKDAELPEEPVRKGYTFVSWINADQITGIKEDLTVTANYKINTYMVRFFDASGKQVGETQKVEYGNAAVSPEELLQDIPTGYVFAGWKVIESSNDSLCDYQSVDSDMKLQAVYYWENEDLPVVNEITNAVWDSTTGNYKISVKLTNYPTEYTTALLRVSLYTSQGKMVKSSKTEFDISADGTTEKEITLKYSGTATVAKACILGINGNDLTGSALSREASKQVTCISDEVWSDWSEWSTTEPQVEEGEELEMSVQYRYADKATTVSTSSSMSGWIQSGSQTQYGDWGGWSSWGRDYVAGSDTREVDTATVYGYYYFRCPNCGAHMHGYPTCYTWAGGCGASSMNLSCGVTVFETTPHSSAGLYEFHGTGKFATDGFPQYGRLFKWTDNGTSAWAGYRYRDRSKTILYSYYRWEDWSSWSENIYTASDSRKVETRTLYRTRKKLPVYSDLTGTEETGTPFEISGALKFKDPNLSGKLATVMVYKGKNADPNEDQIQYIGQTTIGEGNTYSFTIITKEDPSILSGDYTVCLGIEGATGLINVDMLQAPRAEYTVTYVDDDGTELSTQTVSAGDNAIVPESPQKEGYLFVGWSKNAINVNENMTIVAVYSPIQYVIVFSDGGDVSGNGNTYYYGYYGDTIVAPEDPSAEGKIFVGWDQLLEGKTTITGNMIIHAVYETKKFQVVFVDEKGKAVDTQEVAYGECAVPPTVLDVAGMEFLGWNTEKNWWNVTENVTVTPILRYIETVATPSYHIVEMEDSIAIFLESNTKDAEIFYSYGEEIPDSSSIKYEEPIIISNGEMLTKVENTDTEYVMQLSLQLNAIAVGDDKNDSEVQKINYSNKKTYSITKRYNLTFDVNGGDSLEFSALAVNEDEKIGEFPKTARKGYDLIGWFTDSENGEQVTAETIPEKDMIVYAHWQVHEHNYESTEEKKASCTEDGKTIFTCKGCGESYTQTIPATGHLHTEIRNKNEATVDLEGYTGDVYCTDCDKLIKTGTAIPKLEVDENAVSITVNGGKVTAGKEITVSVTISKNTGIAGYSYDVNYDEAAMTLKSVTAGDLLTGIGSFSTNNNVINWNSTDNVTGDGVLMNLVFAVNADTAAGSYPVSVALHEGKKNLVDEDGTFIDANYVAGTVDVTTGTLGDLNGDDDITIADVVLLNRHVLGKAVLASEKLLFADVNGDNDVTIGDVVLLNRHVLGKIDLFGTATLSMGVSTYAANTGTLKIYTEDISVEAGKTVDIPVLISGNTGLGGMALSISLPDGYILNSVKEGELLSSGTFTVNGTDCTWFTNDSMENNGILMTLNVSVAESAADGQISIRVKDGKANNLSDIKGDTVNAVFEAGTITVQSNQKSECDVNGHKGGTATCIKQAVCEICKESYGELDAANHNGETEVRNSRKATVAEEGYTGDVYCKDCGEKIQDGTVIPKLKAINISVDSVTVRKGQNVDVPVRISYNRGVAGAALVFTVTEGVTLNKITRGAVFANGTFDVNGNMFTWHNDETVSDNGILAVLNLTIGENAVDGMISVDVKEGKPNNLSDEDGKTVEAEFKNGTITIDTRTECEINGHKGGTATCNTKAICTVCKQEYGEVNVQNHTGKTEVRNKKEATCVEKGYTGDTYCLDCGKLVKQGSELGQKEHSWDAGVVTKAATATENGVKTYTCSGCRATKTEVIKATGQVSGGSASSSGSTSSGGSTSNTTVPTAKPGTVLNDKTTGGSYTVSSDGLSVQYTKPLNKNAKTLKIPNTVVVNGVTCKVTSIKASAFKNNKKLTSVTIGTNVTTIGSNAFYGCTKLKSVTIGKNVTSIGTKAFYKCTALTKITIPAKVTTIGKQAFYGCTKLKTLSLGKNLKKIDAQAFYKCTALTKVTLPENLKTIGKQAFYGCKKLKNITIKTTVLTSKTVGSKAFSNIYAKATIKVPKSKLKEYKTLLYAKGVNKKAAIKK